MVKILVVAEMQLGRSKPANRAAIRFAQDLAQRTGGAFHIALIGHQLGDAAAELNRYRSGWLYHHRRAALRALSRAVVHRCRRRARSRSGF
jgi:TRAP-type C4-dicarboxylate transport system substrate-binding protein